MHDGMPYMAQSKVKVKVTWRSKSEILPFSKPLSSPPPFSVGAGECPLDIINYATNGVFCPAGFCPGAYAWGGAYVLLWLAQFETTERQLR